MKKSVTFAFMICLMLSCIHQSDGQSIKTFKSINWLAGRWEAEDKKGNVYEEWKLVNEKMMEGKRYKVYKNDTMNKETLRLELADDGIYYITTLLSDNTSGPVCFKLSDGNSMHMDFVNLESDNPKKIKYQWKQNNRFNTEISSSVKGKLKMQLYIYKKVK